MFTGRFASHFCITGFLFCGSLIASNAAAKENKPIYSTSAILTHVNGKKSGDAAVADFVKIPAGSIKKAHDEGRKGALRMYVQFELQEQWIFAPVWMISSKQTDEKGRPAMLFNFFPVANPDTKAGRIIFRSGETKFIIETEVFEIGKIYSLLVKIDQNKVTVECNGKLVEEKPIPNFFKFEEFEDAKGWIGKNNYAEYKLFEGIIHKFSISSK